METERWVADARELLIEIERIYDDHYSNCYDQCVHDIFNAMRRIVRRNAKFQAVEVVYGRWIMKQEPIPWCEDDVDMFWECSVCECRNFDESPYCPNCGADMRGNDDDK